MTTLTRTIPRYALYVLSSAHFLHDFYTGAWLLVLAAQVAWLDLSYTQSGIAAGVYTFASAIAQPTLGRYFDRTGKPYLALWAVAWTTGSIALAAIVPDYLLFLLMSISAGFGSAAFHAAGLNNARQLSSGRAVGRSTAVFLLGGNGGYAVGAYIGGELLNDADNGYIMLLPALLIMTAAPALIYLLKPYLLLSEPKIQTHSVPILTGKRLLPIFAFVMITLMLQTYQGSFATYLPQYFESEGYDLRFAGQVTSLYLLFAAIGSFVGGSLSDHLPRRTLAIGASVALAPLTYFLLRTDDLSLVMVSILAGLCTNMSLPIMLLIGQEILPGGKNQAGGYAFGLTFLTRTVGVSLTGPVADVLGLLETLTLVGFLPLVVMVLFVFLPSRPVDS